MSKMGAGTLLFLAVLWMSVWPFVWFIMTVSTLWLYINRHLDVLLMACSQLADGEFEVALFMGMSWDCMGFTNKNGTNWTSCVANQANTRESDDSQWLETNCFSSFPHCCPFLMSPSPFVHISYSHFSPCVSDAVCNSLCVCRCDSMIAPWLREAASVHCSCMRQLETDLHSRNKRREKDREPWEEEKHLLREDKISSPSGPGHWTFWTILFVRTGILTSQSLSLGGALNSFKNISVTFLSRIRIRKS